MNESRSKGFLDKDFASPRQLWSDAKLVSYSLLSTILGLLINRAIPNRKAGPDLTSSVVIIIIISFFVGSITLHLFCKLLSGKGNLVETISVNLQLNSTLYVMASFITLVSCVVLST